MGIVRAEAKGPSVRGTAPTGGFWPPSRCWGSVASWLPLLDGTQLRVNQEIGGLEVLHGRALRTYLLHLCLP